MAYVVYGIKTCSDVNKFVKTLRDSALDVEFYDYLSQSISPELLTALVKDLGWKQVINLRARNFTALDEDKKQYLKDLIAKGVNEFDEGAYAIIKEQPRIIKRPIIYTGKEYVIITKADQAIETLKSLKS